MNKEKLKDILWKIGRLAVKGAIFLFFFFIVAQIMAKIASMM